MGGGPFAYNRNISNGSSSGGASAGGDRLTVGVLVTCIVAASAGLIFGYDIGISGGVTTMVPFLEKFFPEVTKQGAEAKTTVYCVYDSHALTSFTSSLYVAGFISSLVASRLTASFGRKFTMLLGGVTFLIGGALNAAAESFLMLILGRLFFGFGIGFNNQASSSSLPRRGGATKVAGAFNTGFHLFIGIGVLCASILNYFSSKLPWGWRLSLGCAIFPSLIMLIGLFFISDSPSSLVDRGKLEEARQVLIKLRGEADVENELAELVKASQASKAVSQEPFVIIFQRQYRPHLVMALAIPFFQQISGIFIIAFYAPVLLQSVGSGADSAFLAAIILGIDNIVFILVSTFAVDRCGRRFLFLHGGWLMFLCQAAIGIQLAVAAGVEGTALISKTQALLILLLMCLFGAGFGWSWGPLTWVVPSEIFPLKIRPIGQSISVAINLATTFVLSQTFLAILCRLKFGAFLFYAGWIIIMTAFVALFLPETKGIPLESMSSVWEKHWYWSRFTSERNTLAPP